jgi:hypothetical protein
MANIDSPADDLMFSVNRNQNADGGRPGYPKQTPSSSMPKISEDHGRSDTPEQSGSVNVSTPFSGAPKK